MKIWVEIDSNTPFIVGDVIANENELVEAHDGDRGRFIPYKDMVLRPVDSDMVMVVRKLIADKLRRLAMEISE